MDVKLPKLGEGADSGVVVNIFVKEGDTVAHGQPIIELENEKAVASIPSTAAGKIEKIYIKNGDRVSVGQRLIAIAGQGQPVAGPAPAAKSPAKRTATPAPEPEEAEAEAPGEEEGEIVNPEPVASPSVRKMARELELDLRRIRGSESGGRIIVSDLRNYIHRLIAAAAMAKANGGAGVPAKPPGEPINFAQWGPILKRPLTPLREVIARRMLESWNSVARVTQFDEADFSTLNELRKRFGPAYQAKGVKLTLTPLILKAVAATLKKHPLFNSSLDEAANEIIVKEYYHLGIAVDTDQGLMVPVIRDVDKKSVLDLAKEMEQLAAKARDRKISAEEMKGGTFTISNQGAIGSGHFTPIVNKPETAILGLGRGALKPVASGQKIEARVMTPLALSYDHRVIDGAAAARFMVDLVKNLESFEESNVAMK
jgi:pyruvate dehydrogenase E2 component (dihydrolipoamide acetyltransferase)